MFYITGRPVKPPSGREIASSQIVHKAWNAPEACADCGNDAYIRMSGSGGAAELLCARCYAERVRSGKAVRAAEQAARPAPGARPQ